MPRNRVIDEIWPFEAFPGRPFRAAVPVRQRQAHPLGWADIKKYLEGVGESLRETRDAALLCVGYDTMARRSELVALEAADIEFLQGGTGAR